MKTLSPLSNARFAGRKFLRLKTVDSTNTFCLENGDIMATPGLVVYADRQLAGRGRMGRAWCQGPDGNLSASFVIHPELSPSLIPAITICAGLAVYQALENMGLKGCAMKWPNDVLVNERKVCGILCESRSYGEKITVIAGVGLNIYGDVEEFPSDLAPTLTTLEACGLRTDRDSLLREVTARFDEVLAELHAGLAASLFRKWESASCSMGRLVRFTVDDGEMHGTVAGLDEFGRLIVGDSKGHMHTVFSGEVEYI